MTFSRTTFPRIFMATDIFSETRGMRCLKKDVHVLDFSRVTKTPILKTYMGIAGAPCPQTTPIRHCPCGSVPFTAKSPTMRSR